MINLTEREKLLIELVKLYAANGIWHAESMIDNGVTIEDSTCIKRKLKEMGVDL